MSDPSNGSAQIGHASTVEKDELLDHRYDGIQEYDNPMPGWWVWTFWATFAFSLGYLFHYWAGNGTGDRQGYEQEMVVVRQETARQALAQTVSEESLAKIAADETSQKAGDVVFQSRCAACHGPGGEGLIGPNLTDRFWLHGKGSLLGLYKTVSDGVLEKGMPAWNKQLSPAELRQVVAHLAQLKGKNLAGKAAQGEPE